VTEIGSRRPLPETLAGILDIVADAVITVDSDQRIVYFNRGAEEIFGWCAAEVVGQSLHMLLPLQFSARHDRHMDDFSRGPARARLMGERQEVYGRRKDGTEFPAEASISKLNQGDDVYLTAILRDVTERKRQEDSLRQAMQALSQREAALRMSREELRALSRRLVGSLENERRNIARELHDEAGQALTALALNVGLLERELAPSPTVAARIAELKEQIKAVQVGLHRMAANLRPASLDRVGLVAALQQYVDAFQRQTGLPVEFVTVNNEECRLSGDVETTLYRIAQEALTNVARHSQASHVGVVLEWRRESAWLIVEDDGVGFDVNEAAERDRLGLVGIRERAETVGGEVKIVSAPGAGTTVSVRVPSR
jgi:PAS domain S-box-containing protein